jgi:hypothetical protein
MAVAYVPMFRSESGSNPVEEGPLRRGFDPVHSASILRQIAEFKIRIIDVYVDNTYD